MTKEGVTIRVNVTIWGVTIMKWEISDYAAKRLLICYRFKIKILPKLGNRKAFSFSIKMLYCACKSV